MRKRAVGAGLLAILLVSACGSTEMPKPTPTAIVGDGGGQQAGPGGSAGAPGQSGPIPGGAGGPGGPGAPGGGAGGPGGSIVRKWNERVEETGGDTSSVITQEYVAVVSITLTKVDIGSWTISGTADITSTYTSDFQSHFTTPLGPCDSHYTDDASATGSVDVDGGLEARDGFYQFHVNIAGLDGTNDTVRDDSGCNGTNTQETTPWSVAAAVVGESGSFTGTGFSGSTSEPREGGAETLTWDFTISD